MDLTKVKQDNPSWWIYAFQNKGEITCIVHNGLNKYSRDQLIEKHGQFYEIFGDYPSKYSAEKAALKIEKQESLDPIFYPNKDTEKRFQTQLKNLSKDHLTIIDMGKLPPIYSALGIKDKELKTNIKAILKSQGFEGQNKHQIPEETINNLLPFVYNPKAVFKSLSDSQNPDAYIAVLDAKTNNQEQIIAILSPSKDGQGFTFIPSVYEKHNFERFLERTHEEEKVLYVASKRKGSEIWGTLQLRPRHNSEPYINNIKDFGDIVKYFSQENRSLKSPAKADEIIISKENSMSDHFEEEVKERDLKKEAFLNAIHIRKVVSDAIESGSLSAYMVADGYADTTPAVNILTGKFYHGENLLYLKEHTRSSNFPTAEYLTSSQIDIAKKDIPNLSIRQGQKGVSIYISEKNEESGEWEYKNFRLFNVAQTTRPDLVKDWAEQKKQEKLDEQTAWKVENYGSASIKNTETIQNNKTEIIPSSTDPVKYLGEYFAAVSTNSKFKPTVEQVADFYVNLKKELYQKHEKFDGHSNPFALSDICKEASKHCKEVIREIKMSQKTEPQEQKLDQTQTRGPKL